MALPLFGLVPTGLPVVTAPSETPSPTSALYTLAAPPGRSFNHIVVFLLPGTALPPGTAAAIYLVTPPAAPGQPAPPPRFLGGLGPGKESAIFKISSGSGSDGNSAVIVGISLGEAGAVAARIQEQQAAATTATTTANTAGAEQALVVARDVAVSAPTTLVLAQRIIQNAFNFLASFSNGGSGGEVVPLRAFEEWWRKFEGRVRSDPTFLERAME